MTSCRPAPPCPPPGAPASGGSDDGCDERPKSGAEAAGPPAPRPSATGARTGSGPAAQKCWTAKPTATTSTRARAARAFGSVPHRNCTHSGSRSRTASHARSQRRAGPPAGILGRAARSREGPGRPSQERGGPRTRRGAFVERRRGAFPDTPWGAFPRLGPARPRTGGAPGCGLRGMPYPGIPRSVPRGPGGRPPSHGSPVISLGPQGIPAAPGRFRCIGRQGHRARGRRTGGPGGIEEGRCPHPKASASPWRRSTPRRRPAARLRSSRPATGIRVGPGHPRLINTVRSRPSRAHARSERAGGSEAAEGAEGAVGTDRVVMPTDAKHLAQIPPSASISVDDRPSCG